MNLDLILTGAGTAITTIAVVHSFMRNIRTDIKSDFEKLEKRINQMDNRIFQLAMGKSLKEILLEEKNEEDKK